MRQEQASGDLDGHSSHLSQERRGDARHWTVYRTARVERANDAGLWRVRNMSNRGMLLETGATVTPGEPLIVALSKTVRLGGRVVWSDNGQCGVAFDKAISVGAVLRQLVAEQESEDFRPLCLSVRCSARLLTDDDPKEIIVTRLSQSGVSFTYEGDLQDDAKADVAFADNVWRRGHIRWTRDGEAGLRLASPFALSELESARRFGHG